MRFANHLVLILTLLLLSCNNQPRYSTSPEWSPIVEVAMKSVCTVTILETKTGVPVPRSRGTGYVISQDGYLITNVHVVDGIMSLSLPVIQIEFENGRKYDVDQTVMLPDLDIALLKIDARNLPYLQFEFRKELKRGDPVIALGNPYPFTFTASTGTVSSLDHQFNDHNKFLWIHTSASVSPGMSGGPLLNSDGKVVGTTQAYIPSMNDIYLFIPTMALHDYFKTFFPKYLKN